jgi:uncharacterized protein (TIGR00251 family)
LNIGGRMTLPVGERTFRVKVYPRSAKPRITEEPDGSLKVYVAAAPDKGKANDEVIKTLAGHFGVSKTSVQIVRGQASREKLVRLGE